MPRPQNRVHPIRGNIHGYIQSQWVVYYFPTRKQVVWGDWIDKKKKKPLTTQEKL